MSEHKAMIRIGKNRIGPGEPCFIIAEAGVSHNGDSGLALEMIDVAVRAGVDAVKFQSFNAEMVISPDAAKAEYQDTATGKGESQLEMACKLSLDEQEQRKLYENCGKRNILFLSSPFDELSADFLDSLPVKAFKVGSGELTNHPLLRHIAAKGKPMLVSTGMSSLEDIEEALAVIEEAGKPPVALFHCVSSYPADPEDCNLRAIDSMRDRFKIPVGWSDHTPGIHIAVAAAALGADIIEKHFTLDKNMEGPDHSSSLEPQELTEMVEAVRDTEKALGTGEKKIRSSEKDTVRAARRSVHVIKGLAAGDVIQKDHLAALRPGTGIPPSRMGEFVGKRVLREMSAYTMLKEEDVE